MKNLVSFGLHLGVTTTLAVFYHQLSPSTNLAAPPSASPAPVPVASLAIAEPASAEPASAAPAFVARETPAPLPDQIARALRTGSPAERDRALYRLLPQLIATDPASAGHLALGWTPGPLRDEFLRQVVRHWAEADVAGVLTWLTSLPDTSDRHLAATASTAQVATDDPAGALDLAQVLRVGLDDGSFEHLAQMWTEDDPGSAMAWVQTQSPGPMRDRLLARIAWVRAQSEPAEAAGLVLHHMPTGDRQTAALLGVVRQWAVREPAEAAEWVAHFPAGPLRSLAQTELATARKLTAGK